MSLPQAPFGRSPLHISHCKFGLPTEAINNFNDVGLSVRRLAPRTAWSRVVMHYCSVLIKRHGNKGTGQPRVPQSEEIGNARSRLSRSAHTESREEDLNWIFAAALRKEEQGRAETVEVVRRGIEKRGLISKANYSFLPRDTMGATHTRHHQTATSAQSRNTHTPSIFGRIWYEIVDMSSFRGFYSQGQVLVSPLLVF